MTSEFVHDGLNPVLQGGGTTAVDQLTGLGVDEFFSRTEGAAAEYLLADALGSTVALTDATGVVLTEYSYEPFGAVSVSGASSGNELRYTGREVDGTGLYYYRARYYHPLRNRFICSDPIGFLGGDRNLYAYVRNNPIRNVDPLGLVTFALQIQTSGGGVGHGGSFTTGIVLDDRGQVGFIETVGVGGSGQTTLAGISVGCAACRI